MHDHVWFLNPNWVLLQNILGITIAPLYLQLHINNSALQTGRFLLFWELGLLWPKLDPLQPLGPLFGMPSLPLFT